MFNNSTIINKRNNHLSQSCIRRGCTCRYTGDLSYR